MDYKLALSLKDAGFPQEFKKGDGYYFQWIRALKEPKIPRVLGGLSYHIEKRKDYSECGECECDWCLDILGRAGVKYIIKIPSLEELIDACGDRFVSIKRNPNKNNWYATGMPDKVFGKVPQVIDYKTPKIAVANLYIKLNK